MSIINRFELRLVLTPYITKKLSNYFTPFNFLFIKAMKIKITSTNDQFIIVIFFSFRKSKLNTLYLTERIYGAINFMCIYIV